MHEVEQRTAALEQDLAQRGEAAAAQIRETKARALDNVEQVAVDAAQAIVTKLLGETPDAESARAAVAARMRPAS
jgi:F-type H+-transporting ATPase subunit b